VKDRVKIFSHQRHTHLDLLDTFREIERQINEWLDASKIVKSINQEVVVGAEPGMLTVITILVIVHYSTITDA